jgi:hypothetical protein
MVQKKLLLLLLILLLPLLATGCKDPEKLVKEGNYEEAYNLYMKEAKSLEAKLNGQYNTAYLSQAKSDAAKLAEIYYRAAECKEKMGDPTAARALFAKSGIEKKTVTERYEVQEKIWIDPGYQKVYVPGGYEEVFVEGTYQEVWVDGGYEEVWVDAGYDANNVYQEGHYEQVHQEGHYERVWKEGHYEQEYVEGHYVDKWVEGHYEMKSHYETQDYTFDVDSPYVDMAKAKTGVSSSNSPTAPSVRTSGSIGSDALLKAAKEKLDTAYRRWVSAGSKTSGEEYAAYLSAKKAYDTLKN